MEDQDPRVGAVRRVVAILRRVTRMVQLAPFAYLALMAIYLGSEQFLSEEMAFFVDEILYVNPLVCVGMLALSRVLRLCRWFRIACLIQLIPQVFSHIDIYLFTFTVEEVSLFNSLMAAATAGYLIAAYRHFFCDIHEKDIA